MFSCNCEQRSGRRDGCRTGQEGKSRKQRSPVCDELRSDEEGDTNSRRLRVCRRATQSAQVVVKSDTQQALPPSQVFRAASCATAKAGRSHLSMMGVGRARSCLLVIFQPWKFEVAQKSIALISQPTPLLLGSSETL